MNVTFTKNLLTGSACAKEHINYQRLRHLTDYECALSLTPPDISQYTIRHRTLIDDYIKA